MEYFDQILNVRYNLVTYNATELSATLKDTLKKKYGIKSFADFSKESVVKNIGDTFPEIYEYQNFFILERTDGSLLLLDGFRRLLLYEGLPSININVRVYKEEDLPQAKLLKLMLMLNHTKFFGGIGEYYDKGFNLLFKVLYGFHINEMSNLFEGYITHEDENVTDTYYRERIDMDDKLNNSHERIVQPKTIEDLQFLYEVFKLKPLVNRFKFLGTALYKIRQKFPDAKFDAKAFVKMSDNDIIVKLESGDVSPRGAVGSANVKKLMEMYINILKTQCGDKVEETYAEANERYKKLKADFKKKNKDVIPLTNKLSHDDRKIFLEYLLKHKKSPKLYAIVKPNLSGNSALDVGVYDTLYIKGLMLSYHLMSLNFHLDLAFSDNDLYVDRCFNGRSVYATNKSRYSSDRLRNDMDVFIDLSEMTDFDVILDDRRKK